MNKKRVIVVSTVAAVFITLLTGKYKPLYTNPPMVAGGYTSYGLPITWRLINTSTNPIIKDISWFGLIIDVVFWFLLIFLIVRFVSKSDGKPLSQTDQEERK